jgi:hypothetical protein
VSAGRPRHALLCRRRAALHHVRLSGQSILAHHRPKALQDGRDPGVFSGLAPSGDHSFSYTVPHVLVVAVKDGRIAQMPDVESIIMPGAPSRGATLTRGPPANPHSTDAGAEPGGARLVLPSAAP